MNKHHLLGRQQHIPRFQFSLKTLLAIVTGSAFLSGILSTAGFGLTTQVVAGSFIVGGMIVLPILGTIFIATNYRRTSEIYHRFGPIVLYVFTAAITTVLFVSACRHLLKI